MIPEFATKPNRQKRHSYKKENLLETLKREKESQYKNGIYHKLQIEMSYNSNHIEGSKLSHDQTRFIYETRTIGADSESIKVDEIIETINHFRCFDLVIDSAKRKLSESLIKQLHLILKNNTEDSTKPWFKVGDYKLLDNVAGNFETTPKDKVKDEMKRLISKYNQKDKHTIEDIISFHVEFERIHPFQDGNGRVGRLIAFKECLANNIVPFVIFDENKAFYYRGLNNWDNEKGWLIDTCLNGQEVIKSFLDYFKINY